MGGATLLEDGMALGAGRVLVLGRVFGCWHVALAVSVFQGKEPRAILTAKGGEGEFEGDRRAPQMRLRKWVPSDIVGGRCPV